MAAKGRSKRKAQPKDEEVMEVDLGGGSPLRDLLTMVTAPENIVFRQMEVRDAAAVFHLGEEVFNSSSFPQLYRTWDPFEVTETLAADPELCLVAEELPDDDLNHGPGEARGRVVAFVLGSITEKRRKEQSCGYLSWVAVASSHQRRNIGTFLAMKMFKLFLEDDIHTVIVDTPQENIPAIRFLERLGFGSPVYHVYMSLNISKEPKPVAPVVAGEAKSVKLRHMTIDDLSPVYDLGELVYSVDYPNLFRIWSESEVVELFGSDSDHCMVAERDGKVVGFVLGTTIEKRRNSWRYGYLVWLGVAPEVQRLGVGRRLFHAFYDLMVKEGARIILADTQADNEPARRFFERAGFGSLEAHVYFSKQLTSEDHVQVDDEDGGRSVASGKFTSKVLRMLKFKRGTATFSSAIADPESSSQHSAESSRRIPSTRSSPAGSVSGGSVDGDRSVVLRGRGRQSQRKTMPTEPPQKRSLRQKRDTAASPEEADTAKQGGSKKRRART